MYIFTPMHFSFIILKHIYVLISFDLSAKSNLSDPAQQSRYASCFDWPNNFGHQRESKMVADWSIAPFFYIH